MSVWTWNQFLLALVLVEDPTQRTMAGALGAFQGHYATDIPLLCAGTILILAADPHPLHHLPAPGIRRCSRDGEGMSGCDTSCDAWPRARRRLSRWTDATADVAPPAAADLPGLARRRSAALGDLLEGRSTGLFRGVHVLPPFPSSGDRGFAPLTYDEIDPRFGTWADIERHRRATTTCCST